MCDNLNVRQATALQVFKIITFCMNTRFQSFFTINPLHRPPRSFKIQPMSQQAAAVIVYIADWYCIMPQMR